jgi:hypothetical protein
VGSSRWYAIRRELAVMRGRDTPSGLDHDELAARMLRALYMMFQPDVRDG